MPHPYAFFHVDSYRFFTLLKSPGGPIPQNMARAWEWVKDPPAGEGQVGQ